MKAMLSSLQIVGRGAAKRVSWRILPISLLLAAAGAGGSAEPAVRSEAGASKEYQVKAGFLFNFVQFVEWPAAMFPEPATPISIGILGDDLFGPYLDEIVRGETVKNRPLLVKRSRTVGDLKACHLLFISKSEQGRIAQILASLGDTSIVTVSEIEGFAERGGIINFFLEGHKVRFEINPDAAQRCGLKISSHLLRLAKIVNPARAKI